MQRVIKDMPRYDFSLDSGEMSFQSKLGRYFRCPGVSQEFDYSKVRILHNGVDTVRQLYNGLINKAVYFSLQDSFDSEVYSYYFAGVDWVLGKSSSSGYRYRLQNNDLGLIVFFGCSFVGASFDTGFFEDDLNHLKIEVSPHLILSKSHSELQDMMDSIASYFLKEFSYSGCGVHLCTDVLGWSIPDDYLARLKKRSKLVYVHKGESNFSFEDVGFGLVEYGNLDTVTCGSTSSVQFSIYNKLLESAKHDKYNFWCSVWRCSPSLRNDKVFRVEARFHHSVVRQFSSEFLSFGSMTDEFLQSLWVYALNGCRLHYTDTYLDPMWTILRTEVVFSSQVVAIKRDYKKNCVASCHKNVQLFLGNLLRLCSRKNLSAKSVLFNLRRLPIFSDVMDYYKSRGLNESNLFRNIRDKLDSYRLRGAFV